MKKFLICNLTLIIISLTISGVLSEITSRFLGDWSPWNCGCCHGEEHMPNVMRIKHWCCFDIVNHAVFANICPDSDYQVQSRSCLEHCSENATSSYSHCFPSISDMPYSCLTDLLPVQGIIYPSATSLPSTPAFLLKPFEQVRLFDISPTPISLNPAERTEALPSRMTPLAIQTGNLQTEIIPTPKATVSASKASRSTFSMTLFSSRFYDTEMSSQTSSSSQSMAAKSAFKSVHSSPEMSASSATSSSSTFNFDLTQSVYATKSPKVGLKLEKNDSTYISTSITSILERSKTSNFELELSTEQTWDPPAEHDKTGTIIGAVCGSVTALAILAAVICKFLSARKTLSSAAKPEIDKESHIGI